MVKNRRLAFPCELGIWQGTQGAGGRFLQNEKFGSISGSGRFHVQMDGSALGRYFHF